MKGELRSGCKDLIKENDELRVQLEEAREIITAIRTGCVDALVVEGPKGEQVYTFPGADHFYRIFIEHMNEGAMTIDAGGMIVYANRPFADLVGVPLEQTLGGDLRRFLSQADQSQWDEMMREANGEASRRELSLLSASGESIPVHLSARYLPVDPGPYYCCIVSDLRQQRWNQELEQAVNEKTAELLQSQGRLRALASELNLAEQRERKRLAMELHDHLQQMLVLGKLEIGQSKRLGLDGPGCENILKVDDILSDALTYSRSLVAELSPPVLHNHGLGAGLKWLGDYLKTKHGQTVNVIVPEGTGLTLPEDQTVSLFQSVRELLINAVKHAGAGEVTVRMELHDEQVQVQVRDDGIGFDPAAVDTTPGGGITFKFGLFSIRERMRALGGSFELRSAPGQGTTATVTLPLATRAERVVDSAHSKAKSERDYTPLVMDHSRIRVLLVDDHVMVRQGLRAVLEAYADIDLVGEAGHGEEAVQVVDQLRPAVVVMDINMPTMNGIDATTQIKTSWPETIVIGISVNTTDDNAEAMTRAGEVLLLTKEAAVEELYNAIQEAVKQRGGLYKPDTPQHAKYSIR